MVSYRITTGPGVLKKSTKVEWQSKIFTGLLVDRAADFFNYLVKP
jgi:hypothetical protein